MKCPFCGCEESKVIDSRPTDENERIRRRRECVQCGKRFTTYEVIEDVPIIVIKKDKSREVFDRTKVLKGMLRACEKRPVTSTELENAINEITVENAKKISKDYEAGDMLRVDVTPKDFGRVAAQAAKQVLIQKLREAERGSIYEEFSGREGDIITGTVKWSESRTVFVDLGRVEGILPFAEQIEGETFQPNDKIKCYVQEVRKTTKGPEIILSRTHPGLLKRLFEMEVPEIYSGTVEIKSVVREAGSRAKIAVYAMDPNVDPVGACVGPKGQRVQNIVNELHDEKIDIVRWDEDPAIYIANALSPAKVVSVSVWDEERSSYVIVPDYQLSLAIGKAGQNARLANKLTNWKIDIKSESQAAEEGFGEEIEEDDDILSDIETADTGEGDNV